MISNSAKKTTQLEGNGNPIHSLPYVFEICVHLNRTFDAQNVRSMIIPMFLIARELNSDIEIYRIDIRYPHVLMVNTFELILNSCKYIIK